jgi:hypothetical protein
LVPGQTPGVTKNWAEKNGKFIQSEKHFEGGYRIEYCVVIDTKANEITEYHERQRAFSLSEVVSVLQNAGFGRIECTKDLEGAPATPGEFGVFVCSEPSSGEEA